MADPGHHGQGPYSNSTTTPPKMCFLLEFLASGRDRGGGATFFSLLFLRGWEGGRGSWSVQETIILILKKNSFFFLGRGGGGEGKESSFFPFYIFSFGGGGWRIEMNCTCGPP